MLLLELEYNCPWPRAALLVTCSWVHPGQSPFLIYFLILMHSAQSPLMCPAHEKYSVNMFYPEWLHESSVCSRQLGMEEPACCLHLAFPLTWQPLLPGNLCILPRLPSGWRCAQHSCRGNSKHFPHYILRREKNLVVHSTEPFLAGCVELEVCSLPGQRGTRGSSIAKRRKGIFSISLGQLWPMGLGAHLTTLLFSLLISV